MGGGTVVCTSNVLLEVSNAGGEEISIACGELSATNAAGTEWRGRMFSEGDGIVKGSSPTRSCAGAGNGRARRRECRAGLSSEEIDMDEPNERSKSLTSTPSRRPCAMDVEGPANESSSALQPVIGGGEEKKEEGIQKVKQELWTRDHGRQETASGTRHRVR